MRSQLIQCFKDKQFSILGDSISTLEGFNPCGYKIFYDADNGRKFDVKEMNDTWWGKVINYFGGELLVNNSWSGSRVTKLPGSNGLFPSGCSDERTFGLHIKGINPDVIIVYLGTNDWALGVDTGNEIRILDEKADEDFFALAYTSMLRKLRRNYPQSEIWCCTMCETFIASRPNFSFPHKYAGIHIEEYNEIIREEARWNSCRLIDLYAYQKPYETLDGTHPTCKGMDTIAEIVIREMLQKEYVLLNPSITRVLYSDILKLTFVSDGKEVLFQKNEVIVGRSEESDLLLEGKKSVSRRHATFFFENETWFLRDDYSKNGTWINGVRLHPGKKYKLAANDVINFAMAEKVVFYEGKDIKQSKKEIDELFGIKK